MNAQNPVLGVALVVAACLAWGNGKAARPAVACPAIEGLDAVLQPGATLVFGEVHGTQEIPRFVGDVACRAWTQAPVTVGLEIARDEQGRLDAFLASQGASADRQTLLAGPFWRRPSQDGRSSEAMLELLDRLRTARAAGADVAVVAFDIASTTETKERDREMAAALVDARRAVPRRTFVVLTGNYHSRRTVGAPWDPAAVWMIKFVVDAGVTVSTFDVVSAGGSAWVCMSEGGASGQVCKAWEMSGKSDPGRAWRVERSSDVAGHDGRYGVGATHASPPALTAR